MTKCSKCDNFQARLKRGKLCDTCYDEANADESDAEEDLDDPQYLNKPMSELVVADIIKIVKGANSSISEKLDEFKDDVTGKVSDLEKRVKILESENKKKDRDINTLKYTVVNMQKSLNRLDQEKRYLNAIVSGLPEGEMAFENSTGNREVLQDDNEKIHKLSALMECQININNMKIERIGNVRNGYNRVIKIEFPSSKDRNEFTKNGKKLKENGEIWKKIYVKKDENPVYAGENFRLRDQFRKIKDNPDNAEKSVVLKDGKIFVDNEVVDKNCFFC